MPPETTYPPMTVALLRRILDTLPDDTRVVVLGYNEDGYDDPIPVLGDVLLGGRSHPEWCGEHAVGDGDPDAVRCLILSLYDAHRGQERVEPPDAD